MHWQVRLFFIFLFTLCSLAQAQELSSVCPVGGRERLWAQKRINADLMNAYIDENHLRDPNVKVRVQVVDTGFDQNHIPDLVNASSFISLPGVFGKAAVGPSAPAIPSDPTILPTSPGETSLVGDPLMDVGGHGTMVVG